MLISLSLFFFFFFKPSLLTLVDSSSSDLASSWSCSSCSTSCCDVERTTNKSFPPAHHKSTGALNATNNTNRNISDESKCHRCKHLSLKQDKTTRSRTNGNINTSKGKFMSQVSLQKNDTSVTSASERLTKLFIPLDSPPKRGKSVKLNDCIGKERDKCVDNKCKCCQNTNWIEDDDDDDDEQVDSSFSLSHSSSSTSNSSEDHGKRSMLHERSTVDEKHKIRGGKSKKNITDDSTDKVFHLKCNSLQGNSSSSSSNGYAITSETVNSTHSKSNDKVSKRNINDPRHKYLHNNYNNKCTSCHRDEKKVSTNHQVNHSCTMKNNLSTFHTTNNTYQCNSTSSSSSSFSSSFTSNGSSNLTDENLSNKLKEKEEKNKANTSPCIKQNKKVTGAPASSSSSCSQMIHSSKTSDSKDTNDCNGSNLSTHSVTNNDDQQGQLNTLTLTTHFEVEQVDHLTSDHTHCTRNKVQSKCKDKSTSRRSTLPDHLKSKSSSCAPDHRNKCNNENDSRQLHSTIPTPDYDDSGKFSSLSLFFFFSHSLRFTFKH